MPIGVKEHLFNIITKTIRLAVTFWLFDWSTSIAFFMLTGFSRNKDYSNQHTFSNAMLSLPAKKQADREARNSRKAVFA